MHEAVLFVEDVAHERVLGALVTRLANERGIQLQLRHRSVRGGRGRLIHELQQYERDLRKGVERAPDMLVIATDANCMGYANRRAEVSAEHAPCPTVFAIPDPHIERWLLLDGHAFKSVLGRGCDAPDQKCDRNRYKHQLAQAVVATGVSPLLGGLEYAEDIIQAMDVARVAQADDSFARFVNQLADQFNAWQA